MKMFAIFIAVFIVATGIDVCNAAEGCLDAEKMQFNKTSAQHESDGPCSPFCNCDSCLFSVIVPEPLSGELHYSVPVEAGTDISVFFFEAINKSIWQPPRLTRRSPDMQ